MKRIHLFILAAVASALIMSCGASANNTQGGNAANTASKTTASGPTLDALVALEKQAWEAWKNKDAKFLEGYMSDKYIGFGPTGRTDKATAIRSIVDPKCEVKSFAFSNEEVTLAGSDAAILTFKAAPDYTCGDIKGPKEVWSASIYIREGGNWKSVFYNEVVPNDPQAVVDDSPAAMTSGGDKKTAADLKMSDPTTAALLAIETKAWEAWKKRNPESLSALLTGDFLVIDSAGRHDRGSAVKMWTEPTCEIKSFSVNDPVGVAVTKDLSIFTAKVSADGKCSGFAVKPVWQSSVFVKDGDSWKYVMIFQNPG